IENAYSNFPLRRWDKLEAYWNEAHQLFLSSGNLIWAEKCQPGVTWALMINGRAQESLPILQASHAFTQQIESVWEETEVVRNLGLNHLELGDYGQAIKCIQRAEKLSEQATIPTVKTMSCIYTGMAQRAVLSLKAAKATLITHLEESLLTEEPNIISDWFVSELCAVCALGHEWEEAHHYAKLALTLRNKFSLIPIGFAGWYETEALLWGGDKDLARSDVERFAEMVGIPKRYRLPLLRSQAVLARWDGDVAQAIDHLEGGLALAREMGLPGEEWPILGELGKLYGELEEEEKALQAYKDAALIIHRLAETIDDEGLREGFLTASPIQSIFKNSRPEK
ncbi:MAG: hypothetical protein AAF633_14735, partial [Chloroflexota bacterium]